jgi:hypothetical protein
MNKMKNLHLKALNMKKIMQRENDIQMMNKMY